MRNAIALAIHTLLGIHMTKGDSYNCRRTMNATIYKWDLKLACNAVGVTET